MQQRYTRQGQIWSTAGGARALPEFGGSEKGQSLISGYQSLAITTNTPGFKKLSNNGK